MKFQKTRKSFWEIRTNLQCPVVGTCLTLAEQKKILKKSGVSIFGLTDYQIHQALVHSGQGEGPVSRRIQRVLENKYKRQIAELGDCDEEAFMAHWKKGLQRGELDDLLWIGSTSLNLSPGALTDMFGDYHMHSHGQGMIIRQQLQQVDTLKKQNKTLSEKVKQIGTQKREATQTLQTTTRERNTLKKQVETLQKENQTLRDQPELGHLQKANSLMENKIGTLEHKIQTQGETLTLVKAENEQLTAMVEEQVKIIQRLQAEFEWLTQEEEEMSACSICLDEDACPFRVLIVGGLNTLRPHYQNLVESGGGEFKYFDTLNGSSERNLRPMIGWADVILCPIDFNSHRACLSVKKLCKKMQKPYKMLTNSSISGVSRVLENVSVDLVVA